MRVGGIISFKINGVIYNAKGNFTYSLGKNTREAVLGPSGVHGYTEKATVPFIEGEITDDATLDMDELAAFVDDTVQLELPSGKVVTLHRAWSVNKDGFSGSTEEGAIGLRFEAKRADITF